MPFPVVAANVAWYDDMCPTLTTSCVQNGNRFGGKAAMLGFLVNRSVLGRKQHVGSHSARAGYDLLPHGFGLPVQWYRDFMAHPANAGIKTKIEALVAKEKTGNLSPNERRDLAKEVQALFYVGTVPPEQLTVVNTEIAKLKALEPAMTAMKFRSSANAEDIPNFDGAGLHDSFKVKLTSTDNPDNSCRIEYEQDGVVTKPEIKPKTAQCALKGVYASLWNPRAIEERSFARLDHSTAGMGMSVVPDWDTDGAITANGVIITRAVNSDFLAYTLSIQKDNVLVTNPTPGTIAQMTLATFSGANRPPRFTIFRYATPVAGQPALTSSVMTDAKLNEVVEYSKAIEQAYCRVKPGYYAGDCRYVHLDDAKPSSLDIEFKFLGDGHFVMKQAREFHGR